ncbi:hypothetical protein SAMN05216215_104552 [Saccharopolyspora shandongensis]|uniref:Uncharacterized protein n=1 Tax=Saccharopolyspora shandongensis TaxID=418495 RepID=A0A1H3Q2V8_9PSEU|nr:hypothetical protein SAMN05216215_104552 [Saccharopolyspora shandongensis]
MQFLAGAPPPGVENVLLQQGKSDSIAALSPHAPTLPMDPASWWRRSSRRNFFDRNWLPRSERTIMPRGFRSAMALRNAATASEDFIRWLIE